MTTPLDIATEDVVEAAEAWYDCGMTAFGSGKEPLEVVYEMLQATERLRATIQAMKEMRGQ